MELSRCICNKCKQTINIKEAAMQTDEINYSNQRTPNKKNTLSGIKSPSGKIVKLEACKGDTDEDFETFDGFELSSIKENESIEIEYLGKSLSKDETVQMDPFLCIKPSNLFKIDPWSNKDKDEITEKTRINHFRYRTARQTPDIFHIKNTIKCKTPSLNIDYSDKFYFDDAEELSDSYEKIIKNFTYSNPEEFKLCFKNLVKIEKKSLRDNFYRKTYGKKF
jgi:hypothetical protein